ncbi:MAG: hypothetical protein JOZ69_00975 [Myxococcales bacterium]|nr:hypothetical protein [Myxococcales bacterium]
MTVAYYAASQMLAFTAEQFGFPAITRALSLWGDGKRTADVLREAFGLSPEDYDARFRAWALGRLHRYDGQYIFHLKPMELDEARSEVTANPARAEAHVSLALALAREHKFEGAQAEIAEALRLSPGDLDARYVGAKIARMNKQPAAALAHLTAMQVAGGDGYAVQSALAELARERHDAVAERAALERAHRFDPTQIEALHGLYDLAVAENRDEAALAALRELAVLDQHDRKASRLLLEKLVGEGRWDEARRAGESAVFVDVHDAAIHVGYARALSATGDHEAAAFELESAILCESKPEEKATAHALLARERLTLGDAATARTHRDEALKLDPGCAEAKALKL